MNSFHDNGHWIPLSQIAEEFHKHPRTIRRWCASGFILTLGYRARRDPQGYWYIASIREVNPPQHSPAELRA